MQERKLMNSLIWIAKDVLKRDSNERTFTSDLGVVKALAGLNANNNVDLKNALRSLADNKIEYNIFNKDKHQRGIFSFLSFATIEELGR